MQGMNKINSPCTQRAYNVVEKTDKKLVTKITNCDKYKEGNSLLRECAHVQYLDSVIREKSYFL